MSETLPANRSLPGIRGMRERVLRLPGIARTIQAAVVIATNLRNDPITLRAAALTYLTVLSLVPLLAVVFSIFQAVVGTKELESRLQEFVFQNLAVGVQDNVSHYISQYVQRATSFGAVGFALLLFSSVSLMANVETALNHTFRAPKQRSLALRFGVYWCLLTVGPILLALSLAATALLQSSTFSWLGPIRRALFEFLPAFVTIAAFTLMYAIVPAVPVRRRAALIGAVVAGVMWEVAKIVYASVSEHSARTGAIYGSLSAIPIFLMWAYVSWIIVLFGARVAYAVHAGFLALGAPAVDTPLGRELLVARVMRAVAARFAAGRAPPTDHQVALSVRCPESAVTSALARLQEARLVHLIADGGWVPSRPLEQITLGEVRNAARESDRLSPQATDLRALAEIWERADRAATDVLRLSIADIVRTAGHDPGFEEEGT